MGWVLACWRRLLLACRRRARGARLHRGPRSPQGAAPPSRLSHRSRGHVSRISSRGWFALASISQVNTQLLFQKIALRAAAADACAGRYCGADNMTDRLLHHAAPLLLLTERLLLYDCCCKSDVPKGLSDSVGLFFALSHCHMCLLLLGIVISKSSDAQSTLGGAESCSRCRAVTGCCDE